MIIRQPQAGIVLFDRWVEGHKDSHRQEGADTRLAARPSGGRAALKAGMLFASCKLVWLRDQGDMKPVLSSQPGIWTRVSGTVITCSSKWSLSLGNCSLPLKG